MSQQMMKDDILFYQRLLKADGYYPYKLDGKWGAKTDAADKAFSQRSEALAKKYGTYDARSEANIRTLSIKTQALARMFLQVFKAAGMDVRIISGTRTYAEQDALYRKGRNGNKEARVTNAKGGQSNHNFGIAWDIGLFENGKYSTSVAKYKALAKMVKPMLADLEWGGDWATFPDVPHYQHRAIAGGVAQVRTLFEQGTAYV